MRIVRGVFFFFFNDTATTEIYTLSLHDALPISIESSRQAEQAVSIRRRGTNLDRCSITIKQMEVETLAAEIQTGVQHRNGPPLDSSQSTSWSLSPGRPFFMAFLTIFELRRWHGGGALPALFFLQLRRFVC